MQSGTKKLSPVIMGVALLGYFLPFVTVSCQRQKVASFTGVQLVLGTTVQQPQMVGPPKEQRINGEPLAILAFLCCLAALGLGLAKSRNSEIGTAVAAGIGFIALMLLRSKLEDQALQRSNGMFQVKLSLPSSTIPLLLCSFSSLQISHLPSSHPLSHSFLSATPSSRPSN